MSWCWWLGHHWWVDWATARVSCRRCGTRYQATPVARHTHPKE